MEAAQQEQKKARQIFLNFFFSPKKMDNRDKFYFFNEVLKIKIFLFPCLLKIIFPDHPLRKEAYLDWNIRILPSHPIEIFLKGLPMILVNNN